jgi:hypothetical protein
MIYLNYSRNISQKDCFLDKDKNLFISYMYYEFDRTPKEGKGTLFIIPKREYKIWKVENRSDWKREELVKNKQEKMTKAKELLVSQKDTLLEHFDLYVFYVNQEGMMQEGGYMTDDGQYMDDYVPKDNAMVYTYKYENEMWIEIKKENIRGEVPRTFGTKVVENILKERFGKVILDQ